MMMMMMMMIIIIMANQHALAGGKQHSNPIPENTSSALKAKLSFPDQLKAMSRARNILQYGDGQPPTNTFVDSPYFVHSEKQQMSSKPGKRWNAVSSSQCALYPNGHRLILATFALSSGIRREKTRSVLI